MLTVHDDGLRLCDGVTRRRWLQIGGLGGLGSLIGQHGLSAQAAAPNPSAKAKACIVLCFLGAPPQHETWDPKPAAPAEVRGDLRPIRSAVPGVLVGELMPRTAKLTDKIAVLRAMQTNDNAHSSSGYYMTTGFPHQPLGVENAKPGAPNDWPCLGAAVKALRPQGALSSRALPSAITLPEQSANDGNLTWPGQDAGFLGRSADPWLIDCDPSAKEFRIEGISLPAEVPPLRFDRRRSLLEQVNGHLDNMQRNNVQRDDVQRDNVQRGGPRAPGGLPAYSSRQQQAFDLISSPQGRRAFNLDAEGPHVRDRYGRCRFGQSVLLARRLVEAGVSFVRVNWTRVAGAFNNGHWDTHSNNTGGLKQLMPLMDAAYSALLEDLSQRSLLEQTLVVWMGEFGRTPRINAAAGRDHWGHVFSVALAGGGIRGGVVHGASDAIGGYPHSGRVRPEDLTATILHSLGISPHSELRDRLDRPLAATRGEVIQQIV
jgi:hypothetical protein